MGDPILKPESNLGSRSASLRFLVAVFVIYAMFIAWLGPTNFLFWFCFVFSAGLTGAFCLSLPNRDALLPVIAVVVVFIVPIAFLALFSVALIMNCVVHLVFLLLALPQKSPFRTSQVFFCSVIMTIVSFGTATVMGISPYGKYRNVAQTFDIVDMSMRMEHLSESNQPDAPVAHVLDDSALVDLGQQSFEETVERGQQFLGRTRALKYIHNGTIGQFIKSPGFGVGRILVPSENDAALPEIQNIGFARDIPAIPYHNLTDTSETNNRSLPNFYKHFNIDSDVSGLHRVSMMDFLYPSTYGFKVSPGKFFGFQEHAFHSSPANEANAMFIALKLTLSKLELVSLHRFNEPRVYVLDHLPRMDQLTGDDVPTRKLDEFELQALERMQSNKGIVIENGPDATRMLGALPAFDACLECHSGSRGEVLGAFSYVFEKK